MIAVASSRGGGGGVPRFRGERPAAATARGGVVGVGWCVVMARRTVLGRGELGLAIAPPPVGQAAVIGILAPPPSSSGRRGGWRVRAAASADDAAAAAADDDDAATIARGIASAYVMRRWRWR